LLGFQKGHKFPMRSVKVGNFLSMIGLEQGNVGFPHRNLSLYFLELGALGKWRERKRIAQFNGRNWFHWKASE
jgi:hypothetical protein